MDPWASNLYATSAYHATVFPSLVSLQMFTKGGNCIIKSMFVEILFVRFYVEFLFYRSPFRWKHGPLRRKRSGTISVGRWAGKRDGMDGGIRVWDGGESGGGGA